MSKTDDTTERARDGRYTHALDRVCGCGHRKGQHTAISPHDCCECECEKFKAVRK